MTVNLHLDTVVAGDDKPYNFTFTKDDGSAYDITNWTINMDVFESDDKSTNVISVSSSNHDAPTEGRTSLTLPSGDTSGLRGDYYYEVSVDRANGNHQTVIRGGIKFV